MRCSGTLPFMPIRRLVTWEEPFFHTPLDDVESAVWTGVWAALYSSKEWTVRESKWVDGLRSDNPDTLAGTKSLIIDLEDTNEDELSEPLKTLKPLFEEWLLIVREVSKKLRASLSDPADLPSDAEVQELCLPYFVKYLRQGVDFLRKRGVYDDVVGVDV
ncbi:hypothetical protein OF83DRAFT_1177490 [Amylostereum chailletii]|nr:hypothetical protein OF83DRAFT_1177490 [Amylostereum chailletii]